MTITNDSQLWPKVLICKECQTPVEEGGYQQARIESYFYFCPNCEVLQPTQNVVWRKDSITNETDS